MGSCEQKYIVVKIHDREVQIQVQSVLEQMSARFKARQENSVNRQDDQDSQDRKEDEHACCGKSVFFSSCCVFIHSHISVPPS